MLSYTVFRSGLTGPQRNQLNQMKGTAVTAMAAMAQMANRRRPEANAAAGRDVLLVQLRSGIVADSAQVADIVG